MAQLININLIDYLRKLQKQQKALRFSQFTDQEKTEVNKCINDLKRIVRTKIEAENSKGMQSLGRTIDNALTKELQVTTNIVRDIEVNNYKLVKA